MNLIMVFTSLLWKGRIFLNFRKVNILGVEVSSLTMQEAVSTAEAFMDSKTPHLIATANAEMIMNATHDEELKNILNTADLVVPDGAGTVWASNYLGVDMPERVAGFDLVQNLFANAPAKKRRIFFFGSAPGVAEKAKLEWLFRGMLQPKRIGRLMALPRFVMAVKSYKKMTDKKAVNG